MCLSTAYIGTVESAGAPLCQYVTEVEEADGLLRLTDIGGVVTELRGRLKKVDLIKNVILIDTDAPTV